MIEDTFIETHVKRDNGTAGIVFDVCVWIAALIFIAFLNIIPIMLGINIIFITGMLSFALIWAVIVILRQKNIEYEVEIVNDNFNAAKIVNANKREELVDFSLKDCAYIAPVSSDKFNEHKAKASFCLALTEKKDFPIDDKTWYAFVEGNAPYVVIFGFKPEMYKVFRRYNPRYTENYIVKSESADA